MEVPGGAMLAVPLPEEEVRALLLGAVDGGDQRTGALRGLRTGRSRGRAARRA